MRVKFISTYPPRKCGIAEHARHLVKAVENSGIKPEIIEIKKPTSSNPLYFLNLAKKAAEGTSKQDIIHIQFHVTIFGKLFGILPGFYLIIVLAWLKLFGKAKIVVSLHDSPSKRYSMQGGKKEKILFYYYSFLYIFLRNFTDKLFAHSENGRRINLKDWRIKKEKISVLPLGLPINIKKLNQNKCKKKLGYTNKKILLILGYIRGSKNYNVVLEALKNLKQNVILLIVGKVQLEKDKIVYENILKKIKELGLEKRVYLLGFVEEEKMPALLSAADVGIDLRSQGGGDFLSSTMAMQLSYNTPVVSTNIPSFEILKKEEKCIETFEENDSSDLTEKLKSLLYNQTKIRSLKASAKDYWKRNNWNEVGKIAKNSYLSLIK
jgi:glycosyltransferase involved in cell wall biosynthesis